ncbi:MAG: pantoate--beta-alanine ligase [Dermatophilaceae bacterium]
MKTLRTVAQVRAAVDGRGTVALVPTMGAFHEGHLSLIETARAACHTVVVWLFVNPKQFTETADLAAYPRDESRDAQLAKQCGVDVLFAPGLEEVYPQGFATSVSVAGIGDVLEGVYRPGHFAGVATIVAKMLNMVGPDVAVFGAKDAQQVALVRRLVADLNVPTRIVVAATVREADGLAMSSRNVLLDPAARQRATALYRGLRAAAAAVDHGAREGAVLRAEVESTLVGADVRPEYIAVVHPDTFEPVEKVDGRALVVVAARVGATRLIDNIEVTT